MLSRMLFRLARNDMADRVVRWGFGHLWWLLPVRRLASTSRVLAFRHPRPGWETHILLVPKVGIAGLLALDAADEPLVREILGLARDLGRSHGLPGLPLALVVNGGASQDVGQLHFHLIAGADVPSYRCPEQLGDTLFEDGAIQAGYHPEPGRGTHIVLRPNPAAGDGASDPIEAAAVRAVIATTQDLVCRYDLAGSGFSLIVCGCDGELDFSCVHLVSGKPART